MAEIPLRSEGTVVFLDTVFTGRRDSRILKMILDTGATITTIPAEIAIAIGCDPARPKRRIELITASGTEYAPVITVPKIELLGFKLTNIDIVCHTLPPQSPASGLLGLNILKKFDVLLKFRSGILEVTK